MIKNSIPAHVAIVMDGNGRWAKEKNLQKIDGHLEGANRVRDVLLHAIKRNIQTISLFALSLENMNRPKQEIEDLFKLYFDILETDADNLHQQGIRVKFIGDFSIFSKDMVNGIQKLEKLTRENKKLNLLVALHYSGQWDIWQAAKSLAISQQKNDINVEDLDINHFKKYLSTSEFQEPDLLIRTSGEKRISNYYLWQISYAELYFTKTYWPDFSESEFDKAIASYQERERRFGGRIE